MIACSGTVQPPAASSGDGPGQTSAAQDAKSAELFKLKIEAADASRDYVKQYLKFPLDADFPWALDEEVSTNPEGTKFGVKSTVKAKNAFGATLTHPWTTILSYEDKRFELLLCVIGNETVYESPKLKKAIAARKAEQGMMASETAHELTAEERETAIRADGKARRKAAAARRLHVQKAAAEDSARDPEQIEARAAKLLQSAERLEGEARRKWLQKVIDQFPGTAAAKEAAESPGGQ
jgi:hypothetical protein